MRKQKECVAYPTATTIKNLMGRGELRSQKPFADKCPSKRTMGFQVALVAYGFQNWSLPLAPESQSMWYRIINHKFHCQESISRFLPEVSQSCSFCDAPTETKQHLLVECPVKWGFWSLISRTHFSYMAFQPCHIVSALWSLTILPFVPATTFFMSLRCHSQSYLV
ncbi:hypothetical protein BD560DRAFT_430282 [Blakeslea trispora]|nr:hypothetical protein BD560DRAFT_430282 [Blakeslea trispora]